MRLPWFAEPPVPQFTSCSCFLPAWITKFVALLPLCRRCSAGSSTAAQPQRRRSTSCATSSSARQVRTYWLLQRELTHTRSPAAAAGCSSTPSRQPADHVALCRRADSRAAMPGKSTALFSTDFDGHACNCPLNPHDTSWFQCLTRAWRSRRARAGRARSSATWQVGAALLSAHVLHALLCNMAGGAALQVLHALRSAPAG